MTLALAALVLRTGLSGAAGAQSTGPIPGSEQANAGDAGTGEPKKDEGPIEGEFTEKK